MVHETSVDTSTSSLDDKEKSSLDDKEKSSLDDKEKSSLDDKEKSTSICTVEPHLSGLFTYPDTCLGTIIHVSTESDSLIRTVSLGGVRISEAPLYK